MTRISEEAGAVNLSQGMPDFDPPEAITERLSQIACEGPHQYAITWGAKNFRDALAAKLRHFTGLPVDADRHLVVTCGSTEAMMASMLAVADSGDKVIVFSPFYENYGADAILSGAEPLYVPLIPPDFNFDPERLEDAFRQGPKALILCNPSNPTGKVFTQEELEIIAFLAAKYDSYIITDEVYEHIVYDGRRHIYFAALPGMFERTISCSSLSKTYSITGWRLGYAFAPEKIIETVRKIHDFLTVGAAAPLMEAAIPGLLFPDAYYTGLAESYSEKRDFFCGGLDAAGIRYIRPQGAYYVLCDIGDSGYSSDLEFCEDLARKVGVGAVPGSSFFREDINHLIRLHFAKTKETLSLALDRRGSIAKLRRRGKNGH
jgi:aminotransferase